MLDIKALKSELDIVQVLTQRGLQLTRNGASLFARCPFHADDTPSFSVNPKEQMWHCFGCGAGGDVFTFVQRQEGIDFAEAARKLCKREIQGRDLEDLNAGREGLELEARQVNRPGKEVLDRLVAHWQECLARKREAREYLEGRGLWVPELLRAFKVGYSSGKLPQVLPPDGRLRRQLRAMGILNDRGNEFLYNRIVVPLEDEAGLLVGAYGRTLAAEGSAKHLYLKGVRRGVFNRVGLEGTAAVILTESIFDALSLIVLGFTQTTASYGVKGFTADHRAALLWARVSRVYCAYDADPEGDRGADQLAHDLARHGIEVLRVVLPVKDPNDFLTGGGTREAFQRLLDAAAPMAVAGGAQADRRDDAVAKEVLVPFERTFGDRTYRLDAEPARAGRALSVVLRVSREDRAHVDTFNLYSDRARAVFVGRAVAAFRGQVPRKALEEDLFSLIEELQARASAPAEPSSASSSTPTMTPAQRQEGVAFLERPDLVAAIVEDVTRMGVVGEDDNKLLAYLVATSRKLGKPLSLSVISRASSGKSWLLNRVVDLMPPEEVLRYTRISPQALFYDEPNRFKNKILFIEEAIGARDAALGVRSIQSEQRLANLVTMTDAKTGKLKTQENVVEGPITFLTSSVEPLDPETATRSFEVAIDESSEQTARIVESLRREHTLEGIREQVARERIVTRHRNAQRSLEPLRVVNPYAPRLQFPTSTLRLRREAGKYFFLIAVLALLHQRQRPVRDLVVEGGRERYVEVTPADVGIANRLTALTLTRALSDLPGPAQQLLLKIRDYVSRRSEKDAIDPMGIHFNRREIREWGGWEDHHLRDHLPRLVELEYLEVVGGAFGKRYVYMLSPNHRLLVEAGLTIDQKVAALGLTPAAELENRS